ncbi:MAG TPA: HNH endonuclease signature motif containing protein [Actinomycetota bacterium]|nr:HNH endonuclease signature motif containing protein [Actinomycetota bacterium]
MLRVLRHRDQSCRFPGCEHARWLKAHHVVHWADGGRTDVGNLVLLCHEHHRLLHEGGWRVMGDAGGDLRFHDPTGRPVRTRPGVHLETG